ncbi:major facilitator superfamily domain-containing protein [Echria macrotheca]|uniref:Major facilitator superfamily domain-containing protein n=1 Tax=Echria macrotheca TaxID=438768 RepID=A0AAJ0BHW2_9PEZI|nr:major facilitator superfamily domain-containing protein [Echria macrotheca]
MASLQALAKFAVFADTFLSGLIIPLIPSILETRSKVPQEQTQILVSVLVSAYGAALVAVSPLMPFVARQGRSRFVVLLGALALAAASFILLQIYSSLPILALARALHGLSAAALTGFSSGIAANIGPEAVSPSWVTLPVIHSVAFSLAPVLSGYLYDYVDGERAVFFCAYATILLTGLLGLVAFVFAPEMEVQTGQVSYAPVEHVASTYGTMSLRGGQLRSGYSSVSSSRTASTTSRRSRRSSVSSVFSAAEDNAPVFGIRMFTALYGYLAVGLLTAALQSIIPLLAERQLKWPMFSVGLAFLPMAFPALLTGALSKTLVFRLPQSARFTVGLGFLLGLPAFGYLGHLREDKSTEQMVLFGILAAISAGIGLSADPLVKEITRLMSEVDGTSQAFHHWSATATLPTVTYAWGTLIGPLFAGFTHKLSGWHTMAKSLAGLSAFSAVFTFIFLQGWIGNPRPFGPDRTEAGNDEESAPLLRSNQNSASRATPIGGDRSRSLRKSDLVESAVTDSSDVDLGSSIRTDQPGRHRRHFSIDNFSIATTAVDGRAGTLTDADGQQARFQAALETPAAMGSSFKQQLGNPERRFVMREAPHAPTTDPLLASGNRYVIDEAGADGEHRVKRHVVVFEEGTVPPELLERRQHHVVAINNVDGSVRLASSMDNHAVHVTEEDAPDKFELPESSRRYVVVLLEKGDIGEEEHESR